MQEETSKIQSLSKAQRQEAADVGINLSDPEHLIIFVPNQGFSQKKTNKPIATYNNGLIAMMIERLLKKLPAGSFIANENIPERLKPIKIIKRRGRKPKNKSLTNPFESGESKMS